MTVSQRTNQAGIGARKGFPLPEYPQATHSTPRNGNGDPSHLFLPTTPTVWDALRDVPDADDFEELLDRDWVKARFRKPTKYSAPLSASGSNDPDDFSVPREFDSNLLTSSLRTIHTALSKKRFIAQATSSSRRSGPV